MEPHRWPNVGELPSSNSKCSVSRTEGPREARASPRALARDRDSDLHTRLLLARSLSLQHHLCTAHKSRRRRPSFLRVWDTFRARAFGLLQQKTTGCTAHEQEKFYLTLLEAWKSKMEAPAHLGSCRDPPPGPQTAVFSRCPHRRGRGAPWGLCSRRARIPSPSPKSPPKGPTSKHQNSGR